jgi:hypothetical protein
MNHLSTVALAAFTGFVLAGCQHEFGDKPEDWRAFGHALAESERERERSPETEVWLVNLSNMAIDRCVVAYRSTEQPIPHLMCRHEFAGPFNATAERLFRERSPTPLLIESVSLVAGDSQKEHVVQSEHAPGSKLLITVTEGGAVTVGPLRPQVFP